MRGRLAAMMFVQYFIWGAWYVPMGSYLATLKFTGGQIGLAYSTTAIGAMVSPFFVGMIADRFFATEKILAVLHLCGALLLCLASALTTFGPFFAALLGVTLCYMPTLALTNSLSFHQMKDVAGDFPLIKTLGSIGWIGAGAIVGSFNVGATLIPFRIGAVAAVAMSIYSLTLPHTPPRGAGTRVTVREVLGLDALKLMREWSFAVFVVGSFFVCIPLSFYFSFGNQFLKEAGMANAELKMTLGQVSDVIFLLLMPWFYARLGVKRMLLLGMAAWAGRFVLFGYGNMHGAMALMIYAAILMHGICYDFFFVMGQVYVDNRAPAAIRATAQGFIAFVTLGMGMFVGSWLSGVVVQHFTGPEIGGVPTHTWRAIWLTPAAAAGTILVLFAILFRDRTQTGTAETFAGSAEAHALDAVGAAPP
jgi:nucleoside transporter